MTPLAASVFVTLLFIALAIPFIVRSLIWSRFIHHMKNGDEQKALQILNSSLYKILFSSYDQNWNILRVYISTGDTKHIQSQTKVLLTMKLSDRQAYQVASQAYFYFLDAQDKEWSSILLDKIKAYADEEEIQYNTMLYRILIEKKSEDIETLKELLDKKKKEEVKKDEVEEHRFQIGLLSYLLALQFDYINDKKQKEYYARQAKNDLKHTPYARRAKQLLSNRSN